MNVLDAAELCAEERVDGYIFMFLFCHDENEEHLSPTPCVMGKDGMLSPKFKNRARPFSRTASTQSHAAGPARAESWRRNKGHPDWKRKCAIVFIHRQRGLL